MDRVLSEAQVAQYERHGYAALRNIGAAALALSLLLVSAACTARDDRGDERRPGGFYVGGSGGVTRP